jgi:hypothetical protein
MDPERRLDALLSERDAWPRANGRLPVPDADELAPLLAAASALDPAHHASPRPGFAADLEARLLVYAEALQAQMAETALAEAPAVLPPAQRGIPGAEPEPLPARHERRRADIPRRYPRVLWQAVAAAIVLLVGAGMFTAAASASPGTLLYGLHRWEQNIGVALSTSPADRVQLHISYANEALQALGMAAHAGNDTAYLQALDTLRGETGAASQALADVPAGAEQNALAGQLADLRAHSATALASYLRMLDWQPRVATTAALADLGQPVPHITSVIMASVRSNAGRTLLITVTGSGFEPGAVVVVDGHVTGTVTESSPTTLVVSVSGDGADSRPRAVGVSNPDGTAVESVALTQEPGDEHATPGPESATPGEGTPGADHSGNGSDGGNGHNGEHQSTPTANAQPTPTPHD